MRNLVLLLIVILIAGCTFAPTHTVLIGNTEVEVELAETPEQRETGLMYRESLAEDKGMLFIYEDSAPQSFWMKNTKIPLDLIFISADYGIVDIKENFQPCTADPCETYTSKGSAKYVLEVNAGFVEENEIKINDSVVLNIRAS